MSRTCDQGKVVAGCGAAWLARLTGGQEVPGSNPGSPTRKSRSEAMPLGLLAAASGHSREIHARHRVRSPCPRDPFIVLLLRIDDGGPGGVAHSGRPNSAARGSQTRCRQFDSRTGSPNGVVNTKVPGSFPTRSSTCVRNSANTEAGTSTTRDRCVCHGQRVSGRHIGQVEAMAEAGPGCPAPNPHHGGRAPSETVGTPEW
jgi:hypothetical protein